ncbi:MAG: hypothetical protein KA408_15490 [Flavobacteriales bacterium]|nr:hypothetical protein [Flavobacteriales bacterium]
MRILIHLFFSLFLLQGATAQVITRLSGGTSYFYYPPPLGTDNLANVIAVAANNDTIILPGGIITSYNGLNISKPLTIVGAGVFPAGTPVTDRTIIPNTLGGNSFNISSSGNGSSFHGIQFEDNITLSSGVISISFLRCEFLLSVPLNPPGGSVHANGVQFKHCILRSGIVGGNAQNISVNNCIVQSPGLSFNTIASNISVAQSVFLLTGNGFSGGSPNSTWTNNIFVLQNTSTFDLNGAGSFQNNLFALTGTPSITYGSTGLYTGNQAIPLGPLGASNPNFLNISSVATFNMNVDDYQLKPAGQANAMVGVGGYKVGIFSGPLGNPWKPNAIPFNPHWTGLLPTGGTLGATNGGTINITIQGAAQQN